MLTRKRSQRHHPPHAQWLSRVNPWLKIGLSLVLLGLALFLKQTLAMVALVGGLGLLLTQVRMPLVVALYGLLTLGMFTATAAGLLRDWQGAGLSTLRLLAVVLPSPILTLTTPPAHLIRALQTLRLPSFLTLGVMLIWRFFPLMQQELQRIWQANQLRGIALSRYPQYWFSGLVVPLVFQMVTYADEVTIGLQTRGYSPTAPRSNSQPLSWRWLDTWFCVGAGLWLGLIGYLQWGQ